MTIYILASQNTYPYFQDYVESLISKFPETFKIRFVNSLQRNEILHTDIVIHLQGFRVNPLRGKNIILNTEQVSRDVITENVIKKNDSVIDYSCENIFYIKKSCENVNGLHFPYQVNPKEIYDYKKIYDFCFLGALSEYRRKVILKFGNRIKIVSGFGRKRDNALFRHKILVNIHFNKNYDITEEMRINRCVFNKMIVISEKSSYCEENPISKYMIFCEYDKIYDKCIEVLDRYDYYYKKIFENFDLDKIGQNYYNIMKTSLHGILEKK